MVVTQNALLPNEPSDVHLAKPGLRLCPTTLVLSHLVGRGPPSGPKSVADRRSGSYGNENWEFAVNGLMEKRFACINDLPIRDRGATPADVVSAARSPESRCAAAAARA